MKSYENLIGKYIVIEGIDGSGSTTIVKMLSKFLNDNNIKNITTFEPSDLKIGKYIRQNYNDKINYNTTALALMFAADRVMHGNLRILPNTKDSVVISDRELLSSLAYQSVEELKTESDWIVEINKFAIKPDVIFFLRTSLEKSKERRKNRKNVDKFEEDNNLKTVIENYEKFIQNKDNIYVVDSNESIEVVFSNIINYLKEFPKEKKKTIEETEEEWKKKFLQKS